MKLELFMVLLEERNKETMMAEIKFETEAAGATLILAGHKGNETAELFGTGVSV